jgi:hypothetical protein
MKRALLTLCALMVSSAAISAPGDMSVATFLAKADALKAKGILAIGSPDIDLLKAEVKGAGANYRKRLATDKTAKRPAHSCPPAKTSMDSEVLISHLRTYPTADRPRTSMNTAMADLMKKRYPCK